MSGIGFRLRKERERLGLSQRVFGEIGGVEANAQGKYESGDRAPKADYLAAVAAQGVDVLFVITGIPTPISVDNLSAVEERVLVNYRVLEKEDQEAIRRLTSKMAELTGSYSVKTKPKTEDS